MGVEAKGSAEEAGRVVASVWMDERQELAVFAVATTAAWVHTLDEIRIGELIAVPFGLANVAALGAWRRLDWLGRAATAIAFGLLWGLAVFPYHVAPLLQGTMTGQNVSGLSRVMAGAAMVGLGIAILRRRDQTGEERAGPSERR